MWRILTLAPQSGCKKKRQLSKQQSAKEEAAHLLHHLSSRLFSFFDQVLQLEYEIKRCYMLYNHIKTVIHTVPVI